MYQGKKKFKVLAPIPKKDGSSWWMNVGTMYEGKDSTSFNLYLDALPLHPKEGKVMLHLREFSEEDFREQRERAERRQSALPSGFSSSSASRPGSSYAARGTLMGDDTPLQYGNPAGANAQDAPPF